MAGNEITSRLLALDPNKINELRKTDDILGAYLSDIAGYCLAQDYARATQATAYLFVELTKRASLKPFTVLRRIYHA